MRGMSWETTSTPSPRSAAARIVSTTISVWRAPSAAVGSSIRITFVAHFTARAIATACRWPPERSLDRDVDRSGARSRAARSASSDVPRHRGAREHAEPAEHARSQRARGRGRCSARHAEVGREREVLVDGLDSERVRVAHRGEPTGAPRTPISPASAGTAPHMLFIRVDLPAPLSPTRATISPRCAP